MRSRTRVKICGIGSGEDAEAVARAGGDAVGLVFIERSGRFIDIGSAAIITRELPPFIASVALFMDPDASYVHDVVRAVSPDLLQFHGQESPSFCRQFGRPYIKALATSGVASVAQGIAAYAGARAVLLDSHAPGELGGTGREIDWQAMTADLPSRWILAGGLRPGNVRAAVNRLRPFAVDVSSGVETAPGHKDSDLIKEFINEVRHADNA